LGVQSQQKGADLMAIRLDEWDTKSNEEALGGASFTRTRSVDMSEAFMPGQDDELEVEEGLDAAQTEDQEPGFPVEEKQLMQLVRSAFSQGKSYQEQVLQPRWLASYNAFNNKHTGDSKYSSNRFRGRSRLFRPKTRSTARKKQAEAAAALFSTQDAVIVKAADEANPQQVAGAELVAALLRFRLDRSNENHGIPWFMTSMGAHLNAMQTGICISKQYWEYRKEPDGFEQVPVMSTLPPNVVPLMGGQSSVQIGTELKPKFKIVRDRPRCELMPPEDVIRDPSAAWENQAQDSAYLILRFPMTVEAARTFLNNVNDKSAIQFYDVDDKDLAAAAGGSSDPNNAANIRRAREQGGTDRLTDYAVDNAYKQVWLHENFFRIQGNDYVFWTLGIDRMISEAVPVEEVYPEQGGARPIVVGCGALEPFKIDPMSPVESWQELQREMNDLVNLRLDTLKQTIAPLAKVKRGRSVDIRAIQNRSPDTVVYMQDMGDVEFDRPGTVAGEAYIEMEKLNADFDDQAGNFSTGSVQTNRQLGETVGGMQMMQSNANALGEFDLRVWIETWVEPVLRQLVKLEQYYESDDNVLAISAARAKLFQKFGVDKITDDMLNSQVAVSVDVGLGSSDPMQSLAKFQQASQIALGLLGQGAQMRMKQDAVLDEVFGKAGYKDASTRFFNEADDQDPRIQEMQQAMQQMQAQMQEMSQQLADKQADYATRIKVAQINTLGGLAKQEMSQQHQVKQNFVGAAMGQLSADQDRQFQMEQANADRQFQGEQARAKMQQTAAPPPGAYPGPGEAMQAPEAGSADPAAGMTDEGPQSIQQMLGLAPPPPPADPTQAMAPLIQSMLQGFRLIASQMQQQSAQLAQQLATQEERTMQTVMASGQASDRQSMLLMRQLADMQNATLAEIQQGNERTAAILAAPKRLIRNPQTGAPEGVAPDLSNVPTR
jgi:hypothetical protein